jgi:hypothetical protein
MDVSLNYTCVSSFIIPLGFVQEAQGLNDSKTSFQGMSKVYVSLCRFGFHRPPFNSVDHLHLHCMALPYISW